MDMPRAPAPSDRLSGGKIGLMAMLAIAALLIIVVESILLNDMTDSDPRSIAHHPFTAELLQLVATLTTLAGPFILLGLILTRDHMFAKILGALIVLSSTSLASAATIYGNSSAARVYFGHLEDNSPAPLIQTLMFAFLFGWAIIALSLQGRQRRTT